MCSTESLFLRYIKISTEKLWTQVVFFKIQYIYFYDIMAASEKLIEWFCETISWRTFK